jgi:hypothetical protein
VKALCRAVRRGRVAVASRERLWGDTGRQVLFDARSGTDR